jgi:hypothetical protein
VLRDKCWVTKDKVLSLRRRPARSAAERVRLNPRPHALSFLQKLAFSFFSFCDGWDSILCGADPTSLPQILKSRDPLPDAKGTVVMLAHLLPHVSICERARHFSRVGDNESSIVERFGNSGIVSGG